MSERAQCLADVAEKNGSKGNRRGGREQDANSDEKDQRGGTPMQGNEVRQARKGAAWCQANGPSGRIQRGYGSTRVKRPF